MPFYAGKSNRTFGSPTLHLYQGDGSSTTPHEGTIFHSNLPHVLITSSPTTTLVANGLGGYAGSIPSEVLNAARNGNIVLQCLEYTYNGQTYYYMLNGASMQNSFNLCDAWTRDNDSSPIWDWRGFRGMWSSSATSGDLSLEVGFYNSGSWGTTHGNIGVGSAGMINTINIANHPNEQVWMDTVLYDIWFNKWYHPYRSDLPPSQLTEADWFGYTHFNFNTASRYNSIYIKPNTIPVVEFNDIKNPYFVNNRQTFVDDTYNGQTNVGQVPQSYTSRTTAYKAGYNTLSLESRGTRGKFATYNASYPIVPIRVHWHITNILFTQDNIHTVQYIPTASGITISGSKFQIGSTDMRGLKFIHQIDSAATNNRSDIINIAINQDQSSVNSSIDATYGLPGCTQTGSTVLINPSSGSKSANTHKVGIATFANSTQWFCNSRVPSIGTEHGDIWSPSMKPLKLGTKKTVYVGSFENYPTEYTELKSSGVSTRLLVDNIDLGLSTTSASSILLTMSTNAIQTFRPAGPLAAISYGYETLPTLNRTVTSFKGGFTTALMFTNAKHSIYTLPIGRYVPFLSSRTQAFINAKLEQNDNVWRPPFDYTNSPVSYCYYLYNKGDGKVAIYLRITSNVAFQDTIRGYNPVLALWLTHLVN